MSLGRLLATGRSLMGAQDTPHRFRVNKRVALPKFVSPSNPFTSEAQPVVAGARAEPVSAKTPQPVRATNAPAVTVAPRKLSAVRAVKWVGEVSRKLNPLALLPRRPKAAAVFAKNAETTPAPVQSELSLDTVRVLRNDLSDADAEADVTPRRDPGRLQAPVIAMTARAEAVGQVMDRISAKFFDAGHL